MNTTNLQDEREVDRAADHFVTQLAGLDHRNTEHIVENQPAPHLLPDRESGPQIEELETVGRN
jgi:hypothetical protein